jgi:cytochrome b
VFVWDLPTRVFHWLLAGSFAMAWITHESSRWLDVHVFAGYLFAALLVFRLVWGVAGNAHARFRAFAYPWASVRAYLADLLRGRARRYLGHNPAGAWAIFAMLALGLIVAASGIAALGGEERHGPLAGLLSFRAGAALRELHELAAVVMLGLVAAHLVGVLVESVLHRENLVTAMMSGYKRGEGGAASGYRRVGFALLIATLLSAGASFSGYLLAGPQQPYRPFVGPALPDNALWRAECGSCHLAYHPVLLPARSWDRLLREQAEHFGDDLALDAETIEAIGAFLRAHAAERELTETAWKINATTPAGEAPLRITETRYWRARHRDIPDPVFDTKPVAGRHDCAACHLDAEQGTFEDAAMHIPKAGVDSPIAFPQESKS